MPETLEKITKEKKIIVNSIIQSKARDEPKKKNEVPKEPPKSGGQYNSYFF